MSIYPIQRTVEDYNRLVIRVNEAYNELTEEQKVKCTKYIDLSCLKKLTSKEYKNLIRQAGE